MAFINLGQVMWPVGSIYISENNTSPGSIFGGNWEELNADACLMATGENGSVGYAGSKKITTEQMPSHKHSWRGTFAINFAQGSLPTYKYALFGKDNPQTELDQNLGPQAAGGGQDYLPYSFKCHIWKRKQDA